MSNGPRVPRTTTVEKKVTYRLEFNSAELRKRLRLPADAVLSFGGTEFSQEFGESDKIVATFMVTR